MKRFVWPLQRVLDVTDRRELSLRSEIMTLMQKISILRRKIIHRRTVMRLLLTELDGANGDNHFAMREVFMKASVWSERKSRLLRQGVKELSAERVEKTSALVKLRKKRDRLKQMRLEARQEHVREQLKLEQKGFDETAQIAFVRQSHRRQRRNMMGVTRHDR